MADDSWSPAWEFQTPDHLMPLMRAQGKKFAGNTWIAYFVAISCAGCATVPTQIPIQPVPADVAMTAHLGATSKESFDVSNFHGVRQTRDHWCWAACLAMVYDRSGTQVPQAEIAKSLFGKAYDFGASTDQMRAVLTCSFYESGRLVRVRNVVCDDGMPTPRLLVEHLQENQIVILRLDHRTSCGHAVVVHGYERSRDGTLWLHVFDSSTGESREQYCDISQWVTWSAATALASAD